MLMIPGIFFSKNKVNYLLVNILIVCVFAVLYWLLGNKEHFVFNDGLNQTEMSPVCALYFAINTHCTIGFGDIMPKSNIIRTIIIFQCVCMIGFLFLSSL
jgi:hypothetical protein